jgi:hypothetical protein
MYIAFIILAIISFLLSVMHGIFVLPLAFFIWKIAHVVQVQKDLLYAHIRERNNSMPEVFRKHRDSLVNYVTWGCISLSFLYLAAKTWKLVRVMHEDHGNLLPSSIADIQERDEEAQLEER